MADDFGKQLEAWEQAVEDAVKLTTEEKSQITAAGAEAYAKALHDMTPVSAVSYGPSGKRAGHTTKKQHIRDTITYKDGYTQDNNNTGNTDVGLNDKYSEFVARIVNDGSKKMSPKEQAKMGFVQRAQEAAKPAVTAAMAAKYHELKGGD